MISFRDIERGLRELKISTQTPVVVHSSLASFGDVQGGAETALGAILRCFNAVMMPVFTYKTMLIPATGPENNGITYGSGRHANLMAEFYQSNLPADRMMGVIPETLRKQTNARRSKHPILSFTGINVESALNKQSLFQPLAPLQELSNQQGWVLLIGVDHSVNTTLHLAERLSGRRQFTRWALTPHGVVECPGFPGCSEGFPSIEPYLTTITRRVTIGEAKIQAVPLLPMLDIALELLRKMPLSLLCEKPGCERCHTIRQSMV